VLTENLINITDHFNSLNSTRFISIFHNIQAQNHIIHLKIRNLILTFPIFLKYFVNFIIFSLNFAVLPRKAQVTDPDIELKIFLTSQKD
jgi:hypothetical protein